MKLQDYAIHIEPLPRKEGGGHRTRNQLLFSPTRRWGWKNMAGCIQTRRVRYIGQQRRHPTRHARTETLLRQLLQQSDTRH